MGGIGGGVGGGGRAWRRYGAEVVMVEGWTEVGFQAKTALQWLGFRNEGYLAAALTTSVVIDVSDFGVVVAGIGIRTSSRGCMLRQHDVHCLSQVFHAVSDSLCACVLGSMCRGGLLVEEGGECS